MTRDEARELIAVATGVDTPTATMLVNRFGVELYDGRGQFVGGLTRERIAQGPEAVAEALADILRNLGVAVSLKGNF